MSSYGKMYIALLALPALSLFVLGIIAILDYLEVYGVPIDIENNYILLRQVEYFIRAIVLTFIAAIFSHHVEKIRRFIALLGLMLMILPFSPYGVNGSSGFHWIHINSYTLYVGPWAMILLIPLIAELSIRFRENHVYRYKSLLFFFVITALFAFQKDWAMLILFSLISIILTFKDRLINLPVNKRWICGTFLILILPVGYLWQSYGSSPDHVIENTCSKIGSYPYHLFTSDHDFRNYIIKLVSVDIIKNAGLSGIGFQKFLITGNKCQYVMLEHIKSEYVALITIQQMGLMGLLFVIGLFTMFIFYGFKHLRSITKPFNRHVGWGMLLFIGIQAYLGILKPLNIIPALPPYSLPFMSYGFNSIASSFMALGIIVGLKKQNNNILFQV